MTRVTILALLAACSSRDWNAGNVCVAGGARLTFTVSSDRCVGCSSFACTVRREGDEVIVNSELIWRSWCFERCVKPHTECSSEPLPAGDYVLRHGGRLRKVSVPLAIDDPCTPWHDPHN